MRCLTLASALYKHGINIYFVCRDFPGNMTAVIPKSGFQVELLPHHSSPIQCDDDSVYGKWLGASWKTDVEELGSYIECKNLSVDLLIVDHYAIDHKWEETARSYAKKIFVIDDLANRRHECDYLLDQNFHHNLSVRYSNLIPRQCLQMLGPQYALLREEFCALHSKAVARTGPIKKILVFFGGSDPQNLTEKALMALKCCGDCLNQHIDVVVGIMNPHKERIKALCLNEKDRYSFHCQVDYMSRLMLEADLAIGGGGASSWERCCLGLPSIVINIAENQIDITEALATWGAALSLGNSESVQINVLSEVVTDLIKNNEVLISMSKRGLELVDGNGVHRVIKEIFRN